MTLPLLHFFYTRLVCKSGVLGEKFSRDSLCGGIVWRKCKKDGPRELEGGFKTSNALIKGRT
jgi:hypothetical protein